MPLVWIALRLVLFRMFSVLHYFLMAAFVHEAPPEGESHEYLVGVAMLQTSVRFATSICFAACL